MTEQKKKGIFSRFTGLFTKPDPKDDIEIKLPTWGLSLESQKDLQNRLHTQKLVYKYLSQPISDTSPSEILHKLQMKLNILDAAIGLTGAPWAAPGEKNDKAVWFEAWQGHYADATVLINSIRKYYVDADTSNSPVEYENINTQQIVNMTKDVIVLHYFTPGKIVMTKCFFDKHTTARQIAMVQSFMQQKQQLPYGYGPQQTPQGGE